MKKIRTALAAFTFVFLIGGIQACADSPTALGDDDEPRTECYWINGTLHCSN